MKTMKIEIRNMCKEDIIFICQADNDMSEGFIDYLNRQLENQKKGECSALIALCDGEIAGHVFLYYKCRWGACKNQGLPSAVDLKVFEKYRCKGIGNELMQAAENIAKEHTTKIYLDVCVNSEYGAAQRLYAGRGYLPDGNGIYYEENICKLDEQYMNNDELTMCLIKELQN